MKKTPALVICILIDLIGMASYALPVLGEFSDLIWAPLSGLLFYRLFGGRMGIFGGILSTAEELLPFTDFVPSFTLAWLVRYFLDKRGTAGSLVPTKG